MQYRFSSRLLLGALLGLSAAYSPLAWGQTATTIPKIQGKGATSAMVGQAVIVEGSVTGDFQRSDQLSGFFMQDAKGDDDPETSDGIFVYVNVRSKAANIDLKPGDKVKVTGTVDEFGGQTQISKVEAIDVQGGLAPAITPLTLPLVPGDNFERYEGMLVGFPQKLTVSEHYQLGRYGSLKVSLGRILNPTNIKPVGEIVDDEAQRSFILDDGSEKENPEVTPYLNDLGSRRVGSTIEGLIGIMSESHDAYRLHPTVAPKFEETNPRPAMPPAVGGKLKVAAANVLNYFTSFSDNDSKMRGAKNAGEFNRQSAKVVAELKGLDADVVGLMEIQNNGDVAVSDLVKKLNAAYGAETYGFIGDDPAAIGTDLIKVALIYKIASVTPRGNAISKKDPVFERYPLAQTFVSKANGAVFTVVVNHLKSKGVRKGDTTTDTDKGEGGYNLKRVEQVKVLLPFLESLKQSSGDPDVLAIGDFNAYAEEAPVLAMRAGGLKHLNLRVPIEERYSYVYGGRTGSLDHAFATSELEKQVTGFGEWHINADEPTILEYGDLSDDGFEANPYRASDHDPLIIGLDLTP